MGKACFPGGRGGGLWSRFCHSRYSSAQQASDPGNAKKHLPNAFLLCQHYSRPLTRIAQFNPLGRPARRCSHRCHTDEDAGAQRGQVICPRASSYRRGGSPSGRPDRELEGYSGITHIMCPGPAASALPRDLRENAEPQVPARPYQPRLCTVTRSPGGSNTWSSLRNPGPTKCVSAASPAWL